MSLKFRIIFAGACSILCLMLLFLYTEEVKRSITAERDQAVAALGGEVVKLAVATRTLNVGDVIEAEDIELRDWIADMAPEEAFTSPDELVGMELTSAVPKGAVLSSVSFKASDDLADIPADCVAFTIGVTDRLGISKSIAKGTKLLAYKVSGDGVVLVAKDIEVLGGATTAAKASGASQITLAIPYKWAEVVLESATAGELRLVEPSDETQVVEIGDTGAPEEIGEQAAPEAADAQAEELEPSEEQTLEEEQVQEGGAN